MADLPDHAGLKGKKLPGTTLVLDAKGERFAELFEPEHRRIWVPLAEVPEHVQKAFVAAEDKRFFQHKGIDERGLIRAFMGNLTQPGRPQGGSTITQQVAKNLLVGADITYERKMREIVIAARMERTLTKADILELYLNSIYLGRGSWGIEMAARSYFGKSAKRPHLGGRRAARRPHQGAELLQSRPPSRPRARPPRLCAQPHEGGRRNHRRRGRAREGAAGARFIRARAARFRLPCARRTSRAKPRRRPASRASRRRPTRCARPCIRNCSARRNPRCRRASRATSSTQGGCASKARRQILPKRSSASRPTSKAGVTEPAWHDALRTARLPLYDVHWTPAVVVEKAKPKGGSEVVRVGLGDGRVLPLQAWNAGIRKQFKLHDVIYVQVTEGRGKTPARAELRMRPTVQGATLVLENKTGRILAMAGGFSFPLSQLNRATQAQRQPGSAIKPLVYLAALRQRPAAQHAGLRHADHAAADRARLRARRRRARHLRPRLLWARRLRARAGLLVAEELRQRLVRRDHACAARSRTRRTS